MHKMKRYVLTLSFILGCCGPYALAQKDYAAVHGTVTDTTGAVIPDATVTILNTGTGISSVTTADKNGYYIFPQLQVGLNYSVKVSVPGFENFEATGLTLNVNDNREVDAKLKVGTASQTVEVSATSVQVETSNTQLQQIETAVDLEEIPLEGRDPAGLQKLEPGVVESSDRFGSFSSNGNQTPQNNYVLNGIDINDGPLQNEGIQINPDALVEENIVTSTMNPEFSRNSGAVVNQVLKAGSNGLHGSGFEFYRDTFLNNGNYFSTIRPVFHQNLYGGTLGGPILKSKLFFFAAYQGYRNRTAQTDQPETLNSAQFSGNFTADTNYFTGGPDSAGLTKNPIPFAIGSCPKGEAWNQCFAPNSAGDTTVNIPTSKWNSLAANLISKYVPPATETIGGQAYYTFNALSTAAEDQGILRFDYTPRAQDAFWASSVFQSSPSNNETSFGGGSYPGFGQHSAEHFKLFSASYTHTFTSTKLNELRGGYYRLNFPAVIPTPVQDPSTLGFSINPQLALSGIPYMSVGSYFSLGNSYEGPQPRTDTNMTIADNFSWIRGNHALKFGGSFEQFRVHNPFGYLNNGYYYNSGGGVYSSGDPLIDFALGIPDGYEQANDGFIDAVAQELFGYAQDNWKVSPDFTFNYGISWDAEGPNQNRQFGGVGVVCFQVSSSTSRVFPGGPPGLSYNGDPGCNEAGGPTTHYNRFAPRIGLAWSPSSGPSKLIGGAGSHQLSVRAGFGLYYNRDQEEQSLQNLVDPPVFYTSHGAGDFGGSPAFANPYEDVAGKGSEANPFPFTTPSAGGKVNWGIYNFLGLAAFSPGYSVPYTYNYNLNIQRAFGPDFIAQVGYVGSVSHRLASWYEGDPITPAGHAACLTNGLCTSYPSDIHLFFPQYTAQPAIVPGTAGGGYVGYGVPWYESVGAQTTEGSSNYNSFQASLRKAPSHGLQFTTAYTYSHALDDGSGYESGTGSAGRVRNYVAGFENLNYGDSDFDARHRLATSYAYTVPVSGFLKSNLIARETLGGWEVAGVTALQTGFPVGVSEGTTRSLWCDGSSYFGCPDNPEYSGAAIQKMNIRSSTNQYFGTTPFSTETLGTFGNTSRNFFHGPGFDYTNLQVSKNISFSADNKRYVQLRLEAFNAFNHANFANPSGTFVSGSFGRVTSVDQSADPNGDPSPGRSIQLAGKVFF